jgi:hypothetical protein
MKAGLWRDELLDNNGKPEINSVIESCRSASDWRDHALVAGSEASEGCSQTKLISRQMGNPPTLQVGVGVGAGAGAGAEMQPAPFTVTV